MSRESIFSPRPRHRDGYVLLMVMATSVLVVTVLAALANVSLTRRLQAADADRDLQRRWGAWTLQSAIMPKTPKLFETREELATATPPPTQLPPTLRDAVTLGGVTFDLLLGDEDAKLNLNVLYHLSGQQKTEQALARLNPAATPYMRLQPALPAQQRLRPPRMRASDGDAEQAEQVPDAFRSWGEVFDLIRLERDLGSEAALPIATTGITCWGSGQLNFQRATDEAILAIAGSIVQDGGARRLLKRYRDNPTIDLGGLLQAEVSNSQNRQQLSRLLGRTSNNFSLWIHASTRRGPLHQQLTVMRRDEEGVTRYETFSL